MPCLAALEELVAAVTDLAVVGGAAAQLLVAPAELRGLQSLLHQLADPGDELLRMRVGRIFHRLSALPLDARRKR